MKKLLLKCHLQTILLLCLVETCILFTSCESKVNCPFCHGTKTIHTSDNQNIYCDFCEEDGKVTKEKSKLLMEDMKKVMNAEHNNSSSDGNCTVCHGTGQIQTSTGTQVCGICGGDGDFSLSDGEQIHENEIKSRHSSMDHNDDDRSSNSTKVTCDMCNGTGYCSRCEGSGVAFISEYNANEYTVCPSCNGTKKCHACSGTGVAYTEYH